MKKVAKFKIGIDQETLERLTWQAEQSGLETRGQGSKTPLDQVVNLVKQNVIRAWIEAPELPKYGPELIPNDRMMMEHQVSLPGEMHQRLKELASFARLTVRQMTYDILYLQANCGQPDGRSLPDLSENNVALLKLRQKSSAPVFKTAEEYDAYRRKHDKEVIPELPAGIKIHSDEEVDRLLEEITGQTEAKAKIANYLGLNNPSVNPGRE